MLTPLWLAPLNNAHVGRRKERRIKKTRRGGGEKGNQLPSRRSKPWCPGQGPWVNPPPPQTPSTTTRSLRRCICSEPFTSPSSPGWTSVGVSFLVSTSRSFLPTATDPRRRGVESSLPRRMCPLSEPSICRCSRDTLICRVMDASTACSRAFSD